MSHTLSTLRVKILPDTNWCCLKIISMEQDERNNESVLDHSSDEDYIPGLVDSKASFDESESESECKKPEISPKGSTSETEEEDLLTTKFTVSASTVSSKRDCSHLHCTSKVHKRRKHHRNTSHVAKVECMDVQEIKKCLQCKRCTCGQKCMHKLSAYKQRAVAVIEKMRRQRFAGKQLATFHCAHNQVPPTPG